MGPVAARPINNARLVGVLIYRTHLDWFERWHEMHGGDVSESVSALVALMSGVAGDSAFVTARGGAQSLKGRGKAQGATRLFALCSLHFALCSFSPPDDSFCG